MRGANWQPNEPIPQSISQLGEVLPVNSITLDSNKNNGGVKKWLEIKAMVEVTYSTENTRR